MNRREEGLWTVEAGNIDISGYSAIFEVSGERCGRRDLPRSSAHQHIPPVNIRGNID